MQIKELRNVAEKKRTIVEHRSAGKSSLIKTLKGIGFSKQYKQTIGCDFLSKEIEIKSHKIDVVLWDIGGQNLSSKMMKNYVAKADIVFLTYDITNPSSFSDIPHWHSHIKKESTKNPKVYLLANKCDLEHLRRVKREDHDRYVQDQCEDGRHVSARTGQNLMVVLCEAVAKVCKISVTKQDLAHLKQTLVAHLDVSADEGRTSMADQIEAEDRAAMEAFDNGGGGGCCTIS